MTHYLLSHLATPSALRHRPRQLRLSARTSLACALALLAQLACAAPSHQGESADSSTTDHEYVFGETAPEPGAPDEFCEPFDPARVYLITQFNTSEIIDPEAPEKLCVTALAAYAGDVVHPRLDGGDGSLVWLASTGSLFRLLYVYQERKGDKWRPVGSAERFGELFRPFNDVMLDRIVPCSANPDFAPVLVWSDGAWYGECLGVTSGTDGTLYRIADYLGAYYDVIPQPVGIFDDIAIFATDSLPSGYAIGGDELTPLPLPPGVETVRHLAARSDQGGVAAAVEVIRSNVPTLERARVTAQGIELLGAYEDDFETLVPYGIEYALDGDGALWRLGGSSSQSAGEVVARLPPAGPAEVVYELREELTDETYPRLRLLSASVGRIEALQ